MRPSSGTRPVLCQNRDCHCRGRGECRHQQPGTQPQLAAVDPILVGSDVLIRRGGGRRTCRVIGHPGAGRSGCGRKRDTGGPPRRRHRLAPIRLTRDHLPGRPDSGTGHYRVSGRATDESAGASGHLLSWWSGLRCRCRRCGSHDCGWASRRRRDPPSRGRGRGAG